MQIMIPGLGGRSKYLANSDSNLFWTRLLQTVSAIETIVRAS